MGGVAATACGYGTTTPSPRRRAGTTRPHKRRTNRDAGPAPGARPSGTWPCSGPWPPSPSSGARPSPRPRGRRARTWAFLNTVRGRALAASSTASRARRHSERLSFVLGVSCAAARGAAAGRARQPARDAFFTQLHSDPAAPRGARRPAPRVGGALAVKLLKLVVRTLLAHPFTATDGLATLRGAKAVALPARARMTEVFILQIYPLLFLLSKSHDDMSTSR